MIMSNKDIAIRKIVEMSENSVSKVLIFMAGMEAEQIISETYEADQIRKPSVEHTA